MFVPTVFEHEEAAIEADRRPAVAVKRKATAEAAFYTTGERSAVISRSVESCQAEENRS